MAASSAWRSFGGRAGAQQRGKGRDLDVVLIQIFKMKSPVFKILSNAALKCTIKMQTGREIELIVRGLQ